MTNTETGLTDEEWEAAWGSGASSTNTETGLTDEEWEAAWGSGAPSPDPPFLTTSIFGWTWLGNWAAHNSNAPQAARDFMEKWVGEWEAAAQRELIGEGVGDSPTTVLGNFLQALRGEWWWKDKTAEWEALQKLRYGTGPEGEYTQFVDTTRAYIIDYLDRVLGIRNLDLDEIDKFITDDETGLFWNATSVVGGVPSLDENLANLFIEKHYLPSRSLDTEEGAFDIGPGQLQDMYSWIESLAQSNYVSLSSEEIADMVTMIKREEMNLQEAYSIISRRVGDIYGFLNGSPILDRINRYTPSGDPLSSMTGWGGSSNLRTHLDPIRTSIANVWGLDKSEIKLDNLFGSDLGGAGTGTGLIIEDENAPNGERFMNSREANRWARAQPQFKETAAYTTGMNSLVQSLLKSFGARR